MRLHLPVVLAVANIFRDRTRGLRDPAHACRFDIHAGLSGAADLRIRFGLELVMMERGRDAWFSISMAL